MYLKIINLECCAVGQTTSKREEFHHSKAVVLHFHLQRRFVLSFEANIGELFVLWAEEIPPTDYSRIELFNFNYRSEVFPSGNGIHV